MPALFEVYINSINVCSVTAEKLRSQGLKRGTRIALSAPLLQPTKDSRLIGSIARRLVDQIYVKDVHFAKAGVGLLDLVVEGYSQPDLFVNNQLDLSSQAMAVVDTLNKRYGRDTIFLRAKEYIVLGQWLAI